MPKSVKVRSAALLVATTLVAGVLSGYSSNPIPQLPDAAGADRPVPVTAVAHSYRTPPAETPWRGTDVVWPSGSAEVTPAAAGGATRAGTLPVWLGSTAGGRTASDSIHVDVADQSVATKAGIPGVVVSLQAAAHAASDVRFTVGFEDFQHAYGGEWATRLRLVELPACVLTTPDDPRCRTQAPLRSEKDLTARTVAADIVLGRRDDNGTSPSSVTTRKAPSQAMTVLALTSSPDGGGGGGDYTATSLKPSGSWQAGGSAASFSWTYPINTPSVPGGLAPKINLSYNSQNVDGLTSSTNNQASWIGDGWEYSPGFVERSYQSCNENPAGPTKTPDSCWTANNTLTLSFNGRTTTLIRDDATGEYRPKDDSGERVEYKTNAPNGARDGEYWVVTTNDGSQLYFGLNQLPGWASGNPTTNSVWTAPVYSTTNLPGSCYNANFADSWCQQAYRWNLDYVVDTHSNVMSYFYTTQTNAYARNMGTTASTSYVRGGHLSKIQYGQRAGQVYSTQPAGQVLFTTTGRCNQTTCDPATLNTSTASNWPDVPYDLNCALNSACTSKSPSFWSEHRLSAIQTQVLVGSTQTNVDSWSLTHTYPDTGETSSGPNKSTPSLWLSSIIHTGQDTTAGGSTSPISLPPVVFSSRPLANRVNLLDFPPITRQRMSQITTETGQIITIGYSGPDCASGTPTDPSQNTKRCYPAYWSPSGYVDPIQDWFNKYIVTGVTVDDPMGGNSNDTVATTYTPVGTPAWHHTENPLTPADKRTWDQWRGYSGMVVTTGTAPDPVRKVQYSYFRGMDGDILPSGTRSASITSSRDDPPVTDANQFAGSVYETIVYDGAVIVSDTITTPWTSTATATHAVTGLQAQTAFHTGTAHTKTYTPLADGTTRETATVHTHDTRGRVTAVSDLGDTSTGVDDMCTTTSFADNTTAWIFDKPARTTIVSVACTATPTVPDHVVSDSLTFYDNTTTVGAAPTVGDVTMGQAVSSYSGTTPNYLTITAAVHDQYGRPTTLTDALGRKTTTSYTPASGVAPTAWRSPTR